MSTERKLTIDELIEALELHLSPRTDPNHCDPCPYNPEPSPAGEGVPHAVDEVSLPQNTCQYRLMRDCLDALIQYRNQVDECYFVKDFVEFAIRCDLPDILPGTDDDFSSVRFAFLLGAAFERYKRIWED